MKATFMAHVAGSRLTLLSVFSAACQALQRDSPTLMKKTSYSLFKSSPETDGSLQTDPPCSREG